MRPLIAVVIIAIFAALLVSGCKEEEVVQPPPPPPPDPGWPTMSLQDAAIQYELEEAHYHIRKGRHAAPNSFGSEYEMPLAMGYTQWAFANAAVAAAFPSDDPQVQSRRETLITGAITTADHLILEHGSRFDVPYGHTPRCRWCRHPMATDIPVLARGGTLLVQRQESLGTYSREGPGSETYRREDRQQPDTLRGALAPRRVRITREPRPGAPTPPDRVDLVERSLGFLTIYRLFCECSNCGAQDPFPSGLKLSCTHCHYTAAGTAAAGQNCPSCGQNWRALRKQCSHCALEVPVTRRQGQTCPRCKSKWNFDTPFGNWDTRAPTPVPDRVTFDVSTEEGDLRILGRLRPKKAEAVAPSAAPSATPGPGAPGPPGGPPGPPAPPGGGMDMDGGGGMDLDI